MIPESPEVIDQTAKKLKRLLIRLEKTDDDEKIVEELRNQLHIVTEDYNRAGRVADILADKIVHSIKLQLQAKGIAKLDGIEQDFDHEPAPFEVAYVAYLNQILKGQKTEARETFARMVASESDEDVQSFILSLAKFSVNLQ